MARYVRPADAVGAEAIDADLRKCREAGGIDIATAAMLSGTLDALQLSADPTPENVEHARQSLRALTERAIDDLVVSHPVREKKPDEPLAPKSSWQALGATSLRTLLLTPTGTGGLSTELRQDVAIRFQVHSSTVKRAENLVIALVAAYVFARIAGEPTGLGSVTGRIHARRAPSGQNPDPLTPLIGASEHDVAESLLDSARLPGWGFESQEIGRHEPSRVSTGLVTYALAMVPTIDDATISNVYDEMVSWVGPGGVLPRSDNGVETTWTASQCLLALTGRPHLVDERYPLRLAGALMRYQAGGRWSYRVEGDAHPLYSFYPLLALRRSARLGWVTGLAYKKVAVDSARHLESSLAERPEGKADTILGLASLRLALDGGGGPATQYAAAVRRARKTFTAHDAVTLQHLDVSDDRQPVWHARVSPTMLYLHARRVLGSNHDFTLGLAQRLIDDFDPVHRGWTNSPREGARPYSWTTALGLMSCRALRSDLAAGRVDVNRLRARDDEAVA